MCLSSIIIDIVEHLLSEKELDSRRPSKFRPPFHVIGGSPMSRLVNTNIPSFFWTIYQETYLDLCERFRVDIAIIDYNYARLRKCINIWTLERMRRFRATPQELTLPYSEHAAALEFYLQIDGR